MRIEFIPEIFEKCSEEKRFDADEKCEVVLSRDGLPASLVAQLRAVPLPMLYRTFHAEANPLLKLHRRVVNSLLIWLRESGGLVVETRLPSTSRLLQL
jgi:hypothetical protein